MADEQQMESTTPAETRKTNHYLASELYNEQETRILTWMNKTSFKRFCDLHALSSAAANLSHFWLLFLHD